MVLLVRPIMCNNPVCRCRDVTLSVFDPSVAPEVMDDTEPLAHVSVDIITREISRKHPFSEAGKNLIPVLNEDDWVLLQQVFFSYKREITDAGDFQIKDFYFPTDEIEDTAVHVAYRDILPYGEQLIAQFGDDNFLADDTYCIRNGCDCKEGAISFISAKSGVEKKTHPTIWINHETGSTRVERDSQTDKALAKELYSMLLAKYPDLLKRLEKRKANISDLYQKYRASKSPMVRAVAGPKVGRNEPCPCGSGKKFKKCCATKSSPAPILD